MLDLVISSLYFIAPAYLANMFPVILGKLNFPFGKVIHKKWFGAHKTWRGIYAAYLGALFVLFLQQYFYDIEILQSWSLLDYESINIFFFALLFGFGAILGDLFESFVKRRVGIKEGGVFFPFDQTDFVLGAMLFVFPFYAVSWQVFVTLLLVTPALHFLTNVVAYLLGLKKVWW
ncbi:CDP-archaeol synthase [Candidatus Peregrinibacteria bacterium]|jgi:CDP-2,3-bis-(O-geranylgeranyl)-sn-glycerol synthase|nr:CDP-archaeol synthase [Candidatus Peregrinibacteria bacterium]